MGHDTVTRFALGETMAADAGYGVSRRRQGGAERNLLVAVLKDAVLNYKKHFVCGGARFKEARTWIFDKDTDRLFAFESVCSVLGLSAARIRAHLLSFAAIELCAGERRHLLPADQRLF